LFKATTQLLRTPESAATATLEEVHEAPPPALDVHRRGKPVATGASYSDTPAGVDSTQLFAGVETLATDVLGMKSDKQLVSALESGTLDPLPGNL
jgi:hypothetical protein